MIYTIPTPTESVFHFVQNLLIEKGYSWPNKSKGVSLAYTTSMKYIWVRPYEGYLNYTHINKKEEKTIDSLNELINFPCFVPSLFVSQYEIRLTERGLRIGCELLSWEDVKKIYEFVKDKINEN